MVGQVPGFRWSSGFGIFKFRNIAGHAAQW